MRIRSVRAGEFDLFVEAGGAPEHREEVKRYVESMFAAGAMRPEWCFVAEEDDRILGRVALWSLPGTDKPLALVLLDVPWDGEYMTTGRRLLDEVLGKARTSGAEELEHTLDDPPMRPQFQSYPERRSELLQDAGFRPVRETTRFEWRGDGVPALPGRLTYRTLDEVGEEAFMGAMARVSQGTLDQMIQEERERMGPQAAARSFFEDSREMKHDPSWWQLAYDAADGELVGLVMPAEPPAFLTINYVGVVPEARGRGYVDDLLAVGTATLLSAGTEGKPLRADTDVSNAPMAAAFRRAGWTEFAHRQEYAVRLAPAYRFEWRGDFDNASSTGELRPAEGQGTGGPMIDFTSYPLEVGALHYVSDRAGCVARFRTSGGRIPGRDRGSERLSQKW